MAKIETYRDALQELGLARDFNLRTNEGINQALAIWKEMTVEARRKNDDARAAELSLCKSLIQERHKLHESRICPSCGDFKSATAARCGVCARKRFYPDKIENPSAPMANDLYKIESSIIIPVERGDGALTTAMEMLAKGHIGDSFISDKTNSSINNVAKIYGGRGKIACKSVNPEEKDRHKKRYRVWRTDGKTLYEVNEIIQKRTRGEDITKPEPWTPLPACEVEKLKKKRNTKTEKPPGQ